MFLDAAPNERGIHDSLDPSLLQESSRQGRQIVDAANEYYATVLQPHPTAVAYGDEHPVQTSRTGVPTSTRSAAAMLLRMQPDYP